MVSSGPCLVVRTCLKEALCTYLVQGGMLRADGHRTQYVRSGPSPLNFRTSSADKMGRGAWERRDMLSESRAAKVSV